MKYDVNLPDLFQNQIDTAKIGLILALLGHFYDPQLLIIHGYGLACHHCGTRSNELNSYDC